MHFQVVQVGEFLPQLVEKGPGLFLVLKAQFGAQDLDDLPGYVRLALGGSGRVDLVKGVLLKVDGIEEFGFQMDDRNPPSRFPLPR